MRSVPITLLCLALMLLVEDTYQLKGISQCTCLKTSDAVLRKTNIKSYVRQTAGICHIDAIVFKTFRGFTFCSDPKMPWVKNIMEYLDKKSAKAAIKTTAKAAIKTTAKATIKTTAKPINTTFNATSTADTTSQLNTTGRTRKC